MAEIDGFNAVVTRSGYTNLFRWTSVGNTVQSLPPMQVTDVPWMDTPEDYVEPLWMLNYSDTGAWSVHPDRSEAGFYFAPYTTGVFTLLSSASPRRVAVLPGCLIDVGDTGSTTVAVLTPAAGIVLSQDIVSLLPAGHTAPRIQRAYYLPTGPNAGKISIAVSFTLSGSTYFQFSIPATPGATLAFSTTMYKVGVFGSVLFDLRSEHISAAAGDALGATVYGVAFQSTAESSTAWPVTSYASGNILATGSNVYGGETGVYFSIAGSFDITASTPVSGYSVFVVDYVEEEAFGVSLIPVSESDFTALSGPAADYYINTFFFWADTPVIPPFWTATLRTAETL